MNPKARHDRMIADIEEKIKDPFVKIDDLVWELAKANGMSCREMNTVTKYLLTGVCANTSGFS